MILLIVKIYYINRKDGQKKVEKVYGGVFINLLYGNHWSCRFLSFFLLPLFSNFSFLSKIYGFLQESKLSKRKIKPFIEKFHINTSEFLEPITAFRSFNDFFTRKLNPLSRPFATGDQVIILPADGRYRIYKNLKEGDTFFIKKKQLSLETLLQSRSLAKKYREGSMVIARLAPPDYHRFHFPLDCFPERPYLISGKLFSVNPLALKKNCLILMKNKRMVTVLRNKNFGTVLFIEIGATYVGTIHQTFVYGKHYSKGDEKGYFSFGGSCIILLFEPNRIEFDQDLLKASENHLETLGCLGQSLGSAPCKTKGHPVVGRAYDSMEKSRGIKNESLY